MIQPRFCPLETDVVEAARTDAWSDSLSGHIAHCSTCHDVAVVAWFLSAQVSQAGPLPEPPDPGVIWWKAQLAARRAAIEKATRPIAWAESAAWAVAVLSCLAIAVWQAPALAGMIRLLRQGLGGFDTMIAGGAPGLLLLLAMGAMPFLLYYAVASSLKGTFPRTARQRPQR